MLPVPSDSSSNWVRDMLDYLNLVTRSRNMNNVPNTITIIGVRKALLIGTGVLLEKKCQDKYGQDCYQENRAMLKTLKRSVRQWTNQ